MSNIARILILEHNEIKFITPLSTFDCILPNMLVQKEEHHTFIVNKQEKIPFLTYHKSDFSQNKYALIALLKIRVAQEIQKIAIGINAVPAFAEIHYNDIVWETEAELMVKMIVNNQPILASLLDVKLLTGL